MAIHGPTIYGSTVYETIPKKVQAVLDENGIKGVVRGYTTRLRVGVAFTGWSKKGAVICVLEKLPGEEWRLR